MKDDVFMIRALGFQEQTTFSIPVQGVTIPNGKNEFVVTGDISNYSREAISLAITMHRRSGVNWGDKDYHLHFLYTKYPKTGPSCGLVIYIMLAWLAGALAYEEGYTATATIDLQGYVYPVSNINEKIDCWLDSPSSYLIIAAEQIHNDFSKELKEKKKTIFRISHVDELITVFQ